MFRQSTIAICAALAIAGTLGLSGCKGTVSETEMVASAEEWLSKGDHRAAVIQAKNALSENPDSVKARLLLGRALLMGGELVPAGLELEKAKELGATPDQFAPDLARVRLMTGNMNKLIEEFAEVKLNDPAASADLLSSVATAYGAKGETGKARTLAEQALAAKPGFAPAKVLMAQLEATEGKVDEALVLLDQALSSDADNASAGILRGDLLWKFKKDNAGAEKSFRQVLAKHPESMGAHTSLIAMLAQAGKLDQSKAQFAELKKALPNHPETVFYEAQVAFSNQDYKLTRELTDRLLRVMPENPRVLELSGAAEYRLGQFSSAETFLAKALVNAPTQVMSRQLLAQTYLRSGQPSKALEVLQPVVAGAQPDGVSLSLLGEAHLQLGDSQKADAAFERATQADPKDTRVRTAVAVAQIARGNPAALSELEAIAAAETNPRADLAIISARLRQGDNDGALAAVAALQKKVPDRALADAVRGQILLRKRDNAGARKSFEAALSKEASYFPAVASLGALDLAEGKTDVARKRFDDFIKAHPNNHQAWLAQAELAARTGAPVAEVSRLAREAVRVNPNEPAARRVLVEQLISAGDARGAVVAAQEATVVMPNNPDIAEALGRAQLAARESQQAIATFRRLVSQQPNNPRLQLRLAEAALLMKDGDSARKALMRALEIQPDYLPAKRGLATLAMMEGRAQDALVAARDIQKSRPKDALGWVVEGEVHQSTKSFPAATTAFRAALQRAKTTEVAIKLHNSLLAGSQRAEADRWADQWMKENPRDAGFLFYTGDMALARGENAAAEAIYRSVLDIQPKNALAMNNVAWLMVKQGKPGATALAEEANSLLEDRAPLMDTLATALAAENKLPRAIEIQKRALELDPKNPDIRLGLARYLLQSGEKASARAELETLARLGDRFSSQAEVASLLKGL